MPSPVEQVRAQAPANAFFYKVTMTNSMGGMTTFPRQGFFNLNETPSLAPGKYTILYFTASQEPIPTERTPILVFDSVVAQTAEGPWKNLPGAIKPSEIAAQLSLFSLPNPAAAPGQDRDEDEDNEAADTEEEEAEQEEDEGREREQLHEEHDPGTDPDDLREDREIERRERLFRIEQRVQRINQDNLRRAYYTKEIGENQAYYSTLRLEAAQARKDMFDYHRQSSKQLAIEHDRQREQILKTWDTLEHLLEKSVSKIALPPPPPPDYTPVLMQAIETGGRIAQALIDRGEPSSRRSLGTGDKGPPPLLRKTLERVASLSPVDLAKSFSSPEAMTAFFKEIDATIPKKQDEEKAPAASSGPPLLHKTLERISGLAPTELAKHFSSYEAVAAFMKEIADAVPKGQDPSGSETAAKASDPPTKVVES